MPNGAPERAPQMPSRGSERSVAQWKDLIRASPLTDEADLVAWLRSEFGLGHGYARALVAHARSEGRTRPR